MSSGVRTSSVGALQMSSSCFSMSKGYQPELYGYVCWAAFKKLLFLNPTTATMGRFWFAVLIASPLSFLKGVFWVLKMI